MIDGTILCVDDDTTVLTALRALLGKLGPEHPVEIAESGEEALEIEEEYRKGGRDIAVVISDFIMPGMRGDELLTRIHEANPAIVKIMLTGQSDFDGVKRAINQANLYRFLEKPFNNDDFLLTVKSACLAFHQERELRKQNAELKEMLDMLNKQQEELARSEAKATISTLVASVSHELGTPLGNGVMSADALAQAAAEMQTALESGKISRSDLTNFVATIADGTLLMQRNLKRASDLMSNFKQVAADQASEQRRPFDLAAAIKEILATMAPSIKHKPHKINVDVAPNIVMDSLPGALGQVVINLINNAYLHAFEGRNDGILTITARQEGDKVHLTFADNGIGISEDNLARLTEPFFSTKIGRGGTGLGMSIVDNLVSKSLGGSLDVRSTLGVGTTFDIHLPLSAPAKPAK
jgi:signal transduction histidine kinase